MGKAVFSDYPDVVSVKDVQTKSGYIRLLIHDYKPREAPPADYFAMARELKEIGSNMNQIAFMANATGLVNEAGYYENVIQLRNALRRIEKAVVGDGSEENFTDNRITQRASKESTGT